MITTGLSLATLTGAGFYMLFRKLPRRVRRFMHRHPLVTDAVACGLTYMLFGGTLVALFAAAWMGLIVSMMLAITSNPACNALLERWAQKLGKMKEQFVGWVAAMNPEVEGSQSPKLEVVNG